MSFMYRRECYDQTGPYRLDLEGVEDVELWVRVCFAALSSSLTFFEKELLFLHNV